MIDREKTMRAAEICTNNGVTCEECPYDTLDAVYPSVCMSELIADMYELLKVQEPHWIPFHKRPLTAEEKENHPEWIYILDCALPDDDEVILVSDGKCVWADMFINNGDECYLDSGHELDGVAWMPMPKPYRQTDEQREAVEWDAGHQ